MTKSFFAAHRSARRSLALLLTATALTTGAQAQMCGTVPCKPAAAPRPAPPPQPPRPAPMPQVASPSFTPRAAPNFPVPGAGGSSVPGAGAAPRGYAPPGGGARPYTPPLAGGSGRPYSPPVAGGASPYAPATAARPYAPPARSAGALPPGGAAGPGAPAAGAPRAYTPAPYPGARPGSLAAGGAAARPGMPGAGLRAAGSAIRATNGRSYVFHGQLFAPFRARAYHYVGGGGYRRFGIGAVFPRALWLTDYLVLDWAAYGFGAPPPGAGWIRYGPDMLLVDEGNGAVIDTAYGVFDESVPPADGGDTADASNGQPYDPNGYPTPPQP